jgi:hypothetical protein
MGYEATMYLLERGVHLTGIDGWSWGAPFVYTARKFVETRDASLIGKATRPDAASATAISRNCIIWSSCRLPDSWFRVFRSRSSERQRAGLGRWRSSTDEAARSEDGVVTRSVRL